MSFLPYLLIFVLALVASSHTNDPPSNTLVGYDCLSPNSSISAVSLLETVPCVTNITSDSSKMIDGQIIQMESFQPIHVYTCLVAIEIKATYCGKLSHTFQVSRPIYSYIKHLGRSKCEELHKTGNLNIFGKDIKNLNMNSTNSVSMYLSGEADNNGKCSNGGVFIYDDGYQVSNLLIAASLDITVTDKTETLFLDDDYVIIQSLATRCKANSGYCKDGSFGEALWNYRTANCMKNVDVLYEGFMNLITLTTSNHVELNILSIESDTKKFAVQTKGYSRYCGQTVIDTEQQRIKVIEKGKLSYIFEKDEMYNRNIDLTSYIDTKFLFVTTNIIKNSLQMTASFMDNMCRIKKKVLENRLVLAQMKSNQIGALIEQEKGVSATVQGEILYISVCSPVPVKFRKSNQCTQEFPIWYNDEEHYLMPITRIITKVGTATICPLHMKPGFLINNQWYGYDHQLSRLIEPMTLDPNLENQGWKFESLLDIGKGGLYDTKDMEELQSAMMFGSIRETIGSNVAKVIYDNGNTGNGGLVDYMTDDSISDLGSKIGGVMWTLSSKMGSWFGFVVLVFMILKLVAFMIDLCLNGRSIYKKLGWTLWILAAPLNGFMHFLAMDIFKMDKKPKKVKKNSSYLKETSIPMIENPSAPLADSSTNSMLEQSQTYDGMYPKLHPSPVEDQLVMTDEMMRRKAMT